MPIRLLVCGAFFNDLVATGSLGSVMHAGQVHLGGVASWFCDLERTAPLLDCLIEVLFLLFFSHDFHSSRSPGCWAAVARDSEGCVSALVLEVQGANGIVTTGPLRVDPAGRT